MGTNFYAKEDGQHIGKRSCEGNGKMGFSWAIEIGQMELYKEFFSVEGEMDRSQFLSMLSECRNQYFDFIGVDFS